MLVALPVMVALQMGVGSPSAPALNCSVIVSMLPDTVPVNVPLLLRWQELQDPSFGSGALVRTVPLTVLPLCVIVQSTTVTPCESVLVPFHEPATLRIWVGVVGALVFMPPEHAANTHAPTNDAAADATRQRADMTVTSRLSEPAC